MGEKRKIWVLFLWLESLFILSAAVLTEYLNRSPQSLTFTPSVFFWVCLGLSGVGITVALALVMYNFYTFKKFKTQSQYRTVPVDLEECFRAAKAFGHQSPLYQDGFFKSEVFSIENNKTLSVGEGGILKSPCRVLVEHWSGPDIILEDGKKRYKVAEKNLVKIDLFEKSTLKFSVNKEGRTSKQRASGVIHIIRIPESSI